MIIAERSRNWAVSRVGRSLLVAIVCFGTVLSVDAQSATATLSGIVIDESGASLPDVRVIAAHAATGLKRQVISDAEGRFAIQMLPAGRYSVTAERLGFAPAHVTDLLLSANDAVTIKVELGATVRVQSGFPYSVPLGVRVSAVEDTGDLDGDGIVTELVPQRDVTGLPVWSADYGSVSNLNSGRLPVFARVDLRVTFRPQWQNSRWQLYVEVINLLNRANAGDLTTELAHDPSSDRPRVTTKPGGSLPLLPSLGVRFRF